MREYATGYAKKISHQAFDKAKNYFPENNYYMAFCDDAENVANSIVEAVEKGETIEGICASVRNEVKSSLIQHGTDYVDEKFGQGIDAAINFAADNMREKGQGKRHSAYNKRVDWAADVIKDSIKGNSGDAISRLLDGDDAGAVVEDFVKETARNVAQKTLDKYADEYISDSVNSAVKHLHVTGKGSKKINKSINDVGDVVTERLTANVSANVMDVLYGNKNLEIAVKDITVDTVKQSTKKYIKEQGTKLVEETLETIENATLSFGVETVRNLYLVSKGEMVAKEAASQLANLAEKIVQDGVIRQKMKDVTKIAATNMKKNVVKKVVKTSALTTVCTTIIVAAIDCLFSDKKVSFDNVFDSLIDSTIGSFEGVLQMAATCAGVPGVGEVIGLSLMISSLCSYVHCMGEYGNTEISHRLDEMENVKNVAIQELTRQREILKRLFDENELKWNEALENFETFVIRGAIENNADLVAKGIDGVLKIFGKNVRYSTKEEFEDDFWDSEKAFEF